MFLLRPAFSKAVVLVCLDHGGLAWLMPALVMICCSSVLHVLLGYSYCFHHVIFCLLVPFWLLPRRAVLCFVDGSSMYVLCIPLRSFCPVRKFLLFCTAWYVGLVLCCIWFLLHSGALLFLVFFWRDVCAFSLVSVFRPAFLWGHDLSSSSPVVFSAFWDIAEPI